MSLAPFVSKHLILINGQWHKKQASQDRRAALHQSCYLFAAAHYDQNPGRSGKCGRCALCRGSTYSNMMVWPNMLISLRKCRDQSSLDFDHGYDGSPEGFNELYLAPNWKIDSFVSITIWRPTDYPPTFSSPYSNTLERWLCMKIINLLVCSSLVCLFLASLETLRGNMVEYVVSP